LSTVYLDAFKFKDCQSQNALINKPNIRLKIKNICCIGAGYVGGPTMAVIADKCHDLVVTVVDVNVERINAWNSETLPIYEPGLDEIILRTRGKNLFFSSDIDVAISKADCVFISVNTPTKEYGLGNGKASDLRFLEACARRIAAAATGYTIVVEKSTLPVKAAETVEIVLKSVGGGKKFDVLSNPEFLAEGSAVNDLLNPDRILIGGVSTASDKLAHLYKQWVPEERIILTNLWSSELSKLAANAFLAQRVSSINALSALCEVTGADISEVANAIGRDSRIGEKFLQAGPGFGGSCFKKDIMNLVYLCEFYGLKSVAEYWEQVVKINEWQKHRLSQVVVSKMLNTLYNKKIAILGFAFKKNTNDIRESPAINICQDLITEGARVSVYDPRVLPSAIEKSLNKTGLHSENQVSVSKSLMNAVEAADAVMILTDWEEFKNINWSVVAGNLRKPAWIFDTRRIVRKIDIEELDVNLWSIGTSF
jgi:UDPglucose 6-dehydrogenase